MLYLVLLLKTDFGLVAELLLYCCCTTATDTPLLILVRCVPPQEKEKKKKYRGHTHSSILTRTRWVHNMYTHKHMIPGKRPDLVYVHIVYLVRPVCRPTVAVTSVLFLLSLDHNYPSA